MFGFKKKPAAFDLSPETDAFLGAASREHNEKNESLIKNWGFDSYQEWGFDQETLVFFLNLKNGSRVEAKGQIYGSWSKREKTWEWAWNNPHAEEGAQRDSKRIREYGKKEKLEYLTHGIVLCPTILFATYFASIGEKICEAQGVFPGKMGELSIFIGLSDLKNKK